MKRLFDFFFVFTMCVFTACTVRFLQFLWTANPYYGQSAIFAFIFGFVCILILMIFPIRADGPE